MTEPLTDAQRKRLQAFIDDPDGPVAHARAFGIDVALTIRSALSSPEERWRRANAVIAQTQALSGRAQRIGTPD